MEQVISGVTTVEFATDAAGPFVVNPPTPLGYRFARVSTQSTIPVYFASIFPGVGFSSIVGAFSIAGQGFQTAFGDGLFPFSPDAHNCGDPNYGVLYGGLYTLRWGNPTGSYDPNDPRVLTSIDGVGLVTCTGSMDIMAKQYGFQPGAAKESQDQRGYIDLGSMLGAIGGGGGAALIRSLIMGYPLDSGNPNILWLGSRGLSVPVGDDRSIRRWVHGDCLLHKAVEEFSPAA